MSLKSRLTKATALPLIVALGAGGVAVSDAGLLPEAIPAAHAQTNPCAADNPCAAANPCAANPCAAENPCAAANPCAAENPCAARPAWSGEAANPFDVPADYVQAPFGDAMPDIVKNYLRAAPYVGTGGVVDEGAFARLAELGFRTVINLNTADEGADAEGKAAMAAGLEYVNVAVPTLAPTWSQIDEISAYVNDPQHYPILLHCESANRVGAVWALYRAKNGVPAGLAIQEGRTVGLKPSREGAVREMLELPPLGG